MGSVLLLKTIMIMIESQNWEKKKKKQNCYIIIIQSDYKTDSAKLKSLSLLGL